MRGRSHPLLARSLSPTSLPLLPTPFAFFAFFALFALFALTACEESSPARGGGANPADLTPPMADQRLGDQRPPSPDAAPPEGLRIEGLSGPVEVRFDAPVDAVAPGQAVALFDGDLVLAGGWIARI